MVYKPSVQYGKAKHWHVPGNTALEMSGKEAKNNSTPTRINDGSWLKQAPEGWIRANFHVRIAEVQEGDLVYNSKVDTRVLAVSGDSQPFSIPTSSSTIERTDVCMMGPPTGPMKPVWETKEAKPSKPGVYFIAHNRFGYLSLLNTLDLQVTRVGRRNDLQRKSLANRCAFDDMIKRLKISEHPQFLRRLSQIEQWPVKNFTSPPPPPPPPPPP